MRILILGGDGMLGHQLLQHFSTDHDVRVTLRSDLEDYLAYGLYNKENSYTGIDVRGTERLIEVFSDFSPEVVINAVGIIKQRDDARASIPSIEINALLPHKLSELARMVRGRLIHLSTDCVFSGKRGNYSELDYADAEDLYGRSKYLGEVKDSHCITLRTSIIGLELSRNKSLIEWYLSQRGTIKGFTRAIYTGFTTIEMARIIERVIVQHPDLSGIFQVASEPINKYELLSNLSEKLQRTDLVIEKDTEFFCDRSLSADNFKQSTGYNPPSWDMMLDELSNEIKTREQATQI